MTTRIPALNSLKVFEAAARLGSFKRAAEELHVTPAAVSHQLNQLESLLGVMLFKRISHGIELTQAAQMCLPKLQEGLACVRESIDQIARYSGCGTITLSAPPTFSMRWLMPRLHRFVREHPTLDVQVSTRMGPFRGSRNERHPASSVQAWAAESDLVIMYGTGFYPDLHVEKLMPLSITPLCSASLMHGEHALREPEDLAHHVLMHDDRGSLYSNRSFWSQWLDAVGVRGVDAESGPRFTHAMLALGAVLEDGGVVASTPLLFADHLRSGRLVAPFPIEVPLETAYYIVSTDAARRRDDVASFLEWLRKETQLHDNSVAVELGH